MKHDRYISTYLWNYCICNFLLCQPATPFCQPQRVILIFHKLLVGKFYQNFQSFLMLTLFISGLDTNGCPLGNSKFILLSDNLNICLWLSACQVEKIIKWAWSASHNVIGALDNVNIFCGHILQNFAFALLLFLYTLCYHCTSPYFLRAGLLLQ